MRRANEEIVHPHRFVDRRSIADVGGDHELVEHDVGPRTGPVRDVVPVDDQRPVEPVLLDAIGQTDAPDPVFVSSNLTYTISVTNKGPWAARPTGAG